MIKYLRYELKKFFLYFLLLTALLSIPYMISLATLRTSWTMEGQTFIGKPNLWIVYLGLILFAFINPVVVYSFKMTKRGVDGYYALPIKREKLFLTKTLVGLFLTLAPFTVAYFCGVLVLLCRAGNPYQMQWYAIGYPVFLLLGSCLFGVNAFAFTRANRIGDGVLFMIAYALLGSLAVGYVEKAAHTVMHWWLGASFSSWGGISVFGAFLTDFIMGHSSPHWTWWIFLYPLVTGIGSYFALFFTVKKEKGERAEKISDSWLGYKPLIPVYTALAIGFMPFTWLGFALILLSAIVVTVIYRAKILFSWKYWVMIGVGVVVGLLLLLLVGVLEPPIVNPPDFA